MPGGPWVGSAEKRRQHRISRARAAHLWLWDAWGWHTPTAHPISAPSDLCPNPMYVTTGHRRPSCWPLSLPLQGLFWSQASTEAAVSPPHHLSSWLHNFSSNTETHCWPPSPLSLPFSLPSSTLPMEGGTSSGCQDQTHSLKHILMQILPSFFHLRKQLCPAL